jgi:signal transduction histidine kinase
MLKNLRVRTKLIAVLAVPLAALIVMAGIGVQDRRAEAAEARDGRYLAEMTAARVELVHQLQLERTWTAAAVSGDRTFGVAEATNQRSITDTAVETFMERSDRARGINGPLTEQIDRVVTDLGQLPSVRQSIDGGQVNPQVAVAYYSRVVLGLSDLATVTANASRGSELQADLTSLGALAAAKEAQANINATVAQMLVDGVGRDPQFDALTNAQAELEEQEQRFRELASDDARTEYQTLDTATGSQNALNLLRQIRQSGPGAPLTVPPGEWVTNATLRLDTLRAVEDSVTADVAAEATRIEDDATAAARNFLFGASAVVLISLLLASLVARSIARPLARLTDGAYKLSEERLPALVEHLRNPDSEPVGDELAPIEIDSRDEIGQLAKAFNAIQDVTKNVAAEQATLLRKGIGDIFVNLARRNQTLLDRQIEFIDQLESREEDPDQLENLFKLDHLATRMRRNAESLLVLAGAEPPRRRGRSVDMADVVRVAIGEVEHFARVTLLALDDATVTATVAVDLAHLMSELMENATQFSPPDTQVEIVGHKTRDGNYVLSVSDQGIGMTVDQLADANRLMANPPVVGLALSRSLGFIVIGRLAARFGIVVRLTGSPSGGVSALVTLPASIIDAIPVETGTNRAPVAEAPADAPSVPTVPADISSIDLTPPMIESSLAPPAFAVPPVVAPDAGEPTVDGIELDEPVVEELDARDARTPLADLAPPPVAAAPAGPAAPAPQAGPALPPPPAPPVPVADAGPAETAPEVPLDLRPIVDPAPLGSLFETPQAPAWPAEPAEPASPAAHEPAPLPTRPQPVIAAAPADLAPPPAAPVGTPPPLPSRRPATVAPDNAAGAVTAGGLTRRVPKPTAAAAPERGGAPVSATQRSPEEVRLMLSRYRSGLRRGRIEDDEQPGERQ